MILKSTNLILLLKHLLLHESSFQNKLQLNDDKTENLMIGSAPGIDLPSSIYVGQSDIPFSNEAWCHFDSQLTLKEQVNKLCQLAYLEIRWISPTVSFL